MFFILLHEAILFQITFFCDEVFYSVCDVFIFKEKLAKITVFFSKKVAYLK